MLTLLQYEFTVQNKIYNLVKYFFIFFIFCSTSITLAGAHNQIYDFGVTCLVIFIPMALIGIVPGFLKPEIEDGSLELSLVSFQPLSIAIAKYLCLFASSALGFIINLPFSYILFNIDLSKLATIICCGLLLLSGSCGLGILISSIQCYFRSNTNFLSLLLMPLIIPGIILAGMIIQTSNNYSLILILLGVNCVIVPITICLSAHLIANIYHMPSPNA